MQCYLNSCVEKTVQLYSVFCRVAGPQPAQVPLCCTKCNSLYPSSASAPITVLLYNSVLLCAH